MCISYGTKWRYFYIWFAGIKTDVHRHADLSSIQQLYRIIPTIKILTIKFLNSTNVQTFVRSNEKFDLVIQDSICDHALEGFAHQYDAKRIIFSTLLFDGWIKPYTRFLYPPSYVPQFSSGYSGEMTFVERAHNALISIIAHTLFDQAIYDQNEILHMFWPDAPDLLKLIKDRTALVLLNSHQSFSIPKPSVPHVIDIGGFHIEKPKQLPEVISKNFTDKNTRR